MADDAARIAQLKAELRQFRERDAAAQQEIFALRDANQTLGEQQTATAEVLRVIASSPTDLDSVLQAITDAAARICDATVSMLSRVDDGQYRVVVHHGPLPQPV